LLWAGRGLRDIPMKVVPTIPKINFEENDMCLKEARPTAGTVSLSAFYFEQLTEEDIKVVCIASLTHDSFGFKTKLSVAKHLTSKPEVHNLFCRYGRPDQLPEQQNAGGGHAE